MLNGNMNDPNEAFESDIEVPVILAERDPVSSLGSFRKLLRKLSQLVIEALLTVREEEETGTEEHYSWDWEMIREFIEFNNSRSVFAPALMSVLRSCMKQGKPILVLEGARQEASRYLRGLVSRERDIEIEAELRNLKKSGVFKHQEWREELGPNIEALRDRNMPAFLLHWFLGNQAVSTEDFLGTADIETYTHRSEAEAAEILDANLKTAKSEEEYLTKLEVARYGDLRNESDAANLALLSAINNETKDQKRYRLITGTNVLREMRPYATISPLSSAAILALKDGCVKNPPELVGEYLDGCNARLSTLLRELGVRERILKKRDRDIKRQDIERVRDLLKLLREDPILENLTTLLSGILTVASNEFAQIQVEAARKILDLLPPDDAISEYQALVTSVERSFGYIFDGEAPNMEKLGLAWIGGDMQSSSAIHWELRDRKSEKITLLLDVYKTCYSVYWPSRVPVKRFFNSVNLLLKHVGVTADEMHVVFEDRAPVRITLHEEFRDLIDALRSVQGGGRVLHIAVASQIGDYYYAMPGVSVASFEHVFLEGELDGRLEFERGTEVAVVSDIEDPGVFGILHQGTFAEYIPQSLFASDVEAKVRDVRGQGREESS